MCGERVALPAEKSAKTMIEPGQIEGGGEMTPFVPAERRRSDRLEMTLPVRVEGVDPNGETVEYEGRVRGLSRHGARIEIPWPLDPTHPVRVWTTLGRLKVGSFRVLPEGASDGWRSGYGIESLEDGENFWGIEFPQLEGGAAVEVVAKALLECRMCHALALLPMTAMEMEALRLIGRVGKSCSACQKVSPWKYADVLALERQPNWAQAAIDPVERNHRRVYVQFAVEILDGHGESESAWTENMSRGGFCFASAKEYTAGETIHALFPLDPKRDRTDLQARIVREQPIAGSERRLYGATFEARTESSPLWV